MVWGVGAEEGDMQSLPLSWALRFIVGHTYLSLSQPLHEPIDGTMMSPTSPDERAHKQMVYACKEIPECDTLFTCTWCMSPLFMDGCIVVALMAMVYKKNHNQIIKKCQACFHANAKVAGGKHPASANSHTKLIQCHCLTSWKHKMPQVKESRKYEVFE